jgi:hypothetical protein
LNFPLEGKLRPLAGEGVVNGKNGHETKVLVFDYLSFSEEIFSMSLSV